MQRTIKGYVLLQQLGSSGLATVYRAEDPLERREVTLKVLRPYISADGTLMERFSREMERVARLGHPSILPVYATESEGPLHWVTMQYVSWPTLRQWLQQPIPVAWAMAILRQVAEAVEAAHREGVSHGDIKPGNIFLDPETGRVLLSDFGMAFLREGVPPGMRYALGTPLPTYTAPERSQGSLPNLRSDIYSLGVLLYDMLAGTVPFNALEPATVLTEQLTSSPPLPSRVNPDIPPKLDSIILKALALHPERRYETPGEFVRALEAEAPTLEPISTPFAFIGGTHIQGRLPGMGQGTAVSSSEEGLLVLCTVCGQGNPWGAERCLACRGCLTLSRVAAAAEVQAVTTAEVRGWRRGKIIGRVLLATVLVALVAFPIVNALDITPPLPTPSSTISSASGPGEWAMSPRNLSGPGPVPGERGAFVGRVKWASKTSAPMVSTPAVKGGRVYLTTYDGRVVALDEATGNQIWEYRGSGGIVSSPAVAGDLLFYGGLNSTVTALDADTGEKRWQFETRNLIIGSPIVHDGVVYIGSGDGHIYALDALTGKRQWDHTTKGWIISTPALAGDILVVGSAEGAVHMYDTDTGKRRFVLGVGGSLEGSPLVVGDSIYGATRDGRVYSLNLRETEVPLAKGWYRTRLQLYVWGMLGNPGAPKGVKWITLLGGTFQTTPTADESTLYISSDGGRLYALDRMTGKRRWTFKSGSDYLSAPTIVGNVLLAGDEDGRLHAIDTGSGEEQWVLQIAGDRVSTPVVAGGILYLASRDGTLYAIE